MPHHRILGTTAAAAVAAAVLAPGAASAASATPTATGTSGTGSYVALGDSYAAGVGAPPYTDATCLRSDNAYPALLAKAAHVTTFTFNACSGAETADLLATQLTGLDRRTSAVTVTIGGNDLGFTTGIGTCLMGTDDDCLAVTAAAEQFSADTLPGRLDAVYEAVQRRAPQARLVVTGYAHFFETTGECATVPMSLTKRTALNHAVDALDTAIAARATAAGATFADVRPAFAGHGLCGDDPWLTGPADPAPFHPTAAGQRDGFVPSVVRAVLNRH